MGVPCIGQRGRCSDLLLWNRTFLELDRWLFKHKCIVILDQNSECHQEVHGETRLCSPSFSSSQLHEATMEQSLDA